MKRKVIITADGSATIQIEDLNEQYHSLHGAVQEARHVYINAGLARLEQGEIRLLEIGFGTGLNAFMTYLNAVERKLKVHYTGVEAYPISSEEIKQLNYVSILNAENKAHIFDKLHTAVWENEVAIDDQFTLRKQKKDFLSIAEHNAYDLIYFDAFGAGAQPELWSENLFSKMYTALRPDGILTTYAAKGSARRAMQNVGFVVERLPGPPGKREMLRATAVKK